MIAPARKPEPKVPRLESQAERDILYAVVMGSADNATPEEREAASQITKSFRAEYFTDELRRGAASSLIALQARGQQLSQSLLMSELKGMPDCVDALMDALTNYRSDSFGAWQHNLRLLREAYSHNTGTEAPPPARLNNANNEESDTHGNLGHLGSLDEKSRKTKVGPQLKIAKLSEVLAEDVQWLWFGRLPLGKVSQFAGNGGVGKSFLSLDIATRVTNGSPWPDGGFAPRGNVIILNAEDGLADTVRPRLESMGANLDRVYCVEGVRNGEEYERQFSLRDDIQRLEEFALTIGDVVLIVIDPISSYLAGTDANKSGDVRQALDPLKILAERTGAAVLLINHLTKGTGSALHRACGSIAITAMARTSWAIAKDHNDDQRRLMLPTKCNVGREPTGMAYRISEDGRLEWESEAVRISADEALEHRPGNGGEQRASDKAASWLQNYLASGAIASDNIFADGEKHGHSKRTLFRVKDEIGIQASKQRGVAHGKWMWELPESLMQDSQLPKDASLSIDWPS